MLTALLLLVQPPAAPAVDFVREVQPILREHCWECHDADKQKGDVRLDLRTEVFPADRDLWSVVPGDPDASLLFELVTLPADDDDRMPKRADSLDAEQIETLRAWIAQGAAWPDSADAAVLARAAAKRPRVPALTLDADARARRDRILESLRADRVAAHRIASDTDAVAVNFSVLGERIDDAAIARLRGLEPCLVELDLKRAKVTDAGVRALAEMTALRRLDLSRTDVGDAGVAALAALGELRWLNLFGTEVGDAGLETLSGLRRLERVYLWRTAVTDEGVARLAAALPDCAIDRGGQAAVIAERARRAAQERARLNPTCPLTGKPIDPAFVLDIGGEKTAFCSKTCCEEFARRAEAKAEKK